MRLLSRRRADLFQDALEGAAPVDDEIADLVAAASRIPALAGPSCTPRPEFVDALGARLRAEALTLPSRPPRAAARPAPAGKPLVLVVGRGLPRALAGAAATVLIASTVVGVASRSALPGTALYPVKQLLDSAAVQLAGSDHDKGMTLLAQAQQHISEAVDLVDAGNPDPALVNEALGNAYEATLDGQRILFAVYDRDHDQQSLIATQDFAARAIPQLQALRDRVPAASVPSVDRLLALLQLGDEAAARKLAACGAPCASASAPATGPGPSSLPSLPSVPVPKGLPTTASPHLSLPSGATSIPGAPLPGGSLQIGGGSLGASLPGGSVSVPLPGVSVGGGGTSSAGISASVPGVGGASVGGSGLKVQLPGAGVSAGTGGVAVSPSGTTPVVIPNPGGLTDVLPSVTSVPKLP